MGLIDRNKEEVTPAIQQFLRCPAIMADRLTKSHNDLVRQVGGLDRGICLLLTLPLSLESIVRATHTRQLLVSKFLLLPAA